LRGDTFFQQLPATRRPFRRRASEVAVGIDLGADCVAIDPRLETRTSSEAAALVIQILAFALIVFEALFVISQLPQAF
jgi:hypothetical protein